MLVFPDSSRVAVPAPRVAEAPMSGAVKVTMKEKKLDFEYIEASVPALPKPEGDGDEPASERVEAAHRADALEVVEDVVMPWSYVGKRGGHMEPSGARRRGRTLVPLAALGDRAGVHSSRHGDARPAKSSPASPPCAAPTIGGGSAPDRRSG